ncbi:MAG: PhnD/SsuA/transferrin family substrate-binding protein [Desulfurivibrio sp.]|nr:PhnD/SsuA/transferrin family substrate-binding protein [Desulfurivibrio sp.]
MVLILLLISLSGCSNQVATAADNRPELVFAALPTESPKTVFKEVRPLLDYLGKHLEVEFTIEYAASYGELLAKFQDNAIDLAFLGPLPYVVLREKQPAAEPVVIFLEEDGQPTYTCSLLVTMDEAMNGIGEPAALATHPLALTNPYSTCGYLVSDHILNRFGLSLEQIGYQYLDSHTRVALAVARGEYAAGGIKTSIGRKYLHLGLEFLAESEEVPGRPLVANGETVPGEVLAELRRLLTAPDSRDEPAARAVTRGWGRLFQHGAVAATDQDFDPLRRMLEDREIPGL